MANSHPHIHCPKCGSWTRWNKRNLKLFNHQDNFLTMLNQTKEYCDYGGKSIVHFYYKQIDELKQYHTHYYQTNKDDLTFLSYYSGRLQFLTTELRKIIENDKL
jgi:hypothetical protein